MSLFLGSANRREDLEESNLTLDSQGVEMISLFGKTSKFDR